MKHMLLLLVYDWLINVITQSILDKCSCWWNLHFLSCCLLASLYHKALGDWKYCCAPCKCCVWSTISCYYIVWTWIPHLHQSSLASISIFLSTFWIHLNQYMSSTYVGKCWNSCAWRLTQLDRASSTKAALGTLEWAQALRLCSLSIPNWDNGSSFSHS